MWDPEQHLLQKLEHEKGNLSASDPDRWISVTSYIFKALNSIVSHPCLCFPRERCPGWLQSILCLSIYPVRACSGFTTIRNLGPDIFVPDSELLNESFRGKVTLLDFGKNYIWDIIPILRCSKVGLRYLSEYNDPTTMEVKILEPVDDYAMMLKEIWIRKHDLTRY